MSKRIAIFLMLVLVGLSVSAYAGSKDKVKSYTGTLSCVACDLKNLDGVNSQCEAFGHTHCLRLDNGKYIYFLQNDHSEALIKGGGRHNTRAKVTGIYNADSHTIDVQSYEIDGVKTAWCDEHGRMDMCMYQRAEKAKSEKSSMVEKSEK